MQNAIKRRIKELCARAIIRAQRKRARKELYAKKYQKRTGFTSAPGQSNPTFPHNHFDPKYCKRHANILAKTIWKKILEGTYEPKPALKFSIPKAAGGHRDVMQFSFPDAAVASVLNIRLTLRNLKTQSGNSYAYLPDRDVFDALLKLKSAIKPQRNFVLQLDFEKYFDKIEHHYIRSLLSNKNYIMLSETERQAIYAFLRHRFADSDGYKAGKFDKRRIGTPQGSSISLTLANLANHPLDLALEALNGQFVRYADDTTVVTYSYEDAIRAYDTFNFHCEKGGLSINKSKSPGIWILSDVDEEFRTMKDFKFLGYGLSTKGLLMHKSVEKRLMVKLSRLINLYLIQYIKKMPPQGVNRVGSDYDWDLLGLVTEIRNMIYGGISEDQLSAFLKQGKKLPRLRGLMGFYGLLDDKEALMRLDGWLVSTTAQALHKRYKLLKIKKKVSARSILTGDWYNSGYSQGKFQPDPRMPSFVRARAAARKHTKTFGFDDVEPPRYLSYY